MGSVLKVLKGEKGFCFSIIFAFSPILISPLSIPSSCCQGGSAQKDNCKQANQISSQKSAFGVTSMDFFGMVTTLSSKPSQGGAFSLTERCRWPGRSRQRGGTGGVERFGGGEGKAHLLYSWPLCVKQALWAVTELERSASERPLALP